MATLTSWQGILHDGFATVQVESAPRYFASNRIRVFTSNVMAGLLQTPAYTEALLHTIAGFSGTPDDAEAGAAKRAERSEVINDESKDIRIILEEAVLRRRIGGAAVMAEQLEHVRAAMELPALTLGVIPAGTDWRGIWPLEAFYLFDDTQVQVELLTEFVEIADGEAIAAYGRAFDLLADLARFGDSAHDLITAAIAELGV
jgi:hypothetical protein